MLTAQPSLDARQIERKQMKMAMSVGKNRHYRFEEIHGRHFIQTGEEAGFPKGLVRGVIEEIAPVAKGIAGIKFQNGIEVIKMPAHHAV